MDVSGGGVAVATVDVFGVQGSGFYDSGAPQFSCCQDRASALPEASLLTRTLTLNPKPCCPRCCPPQDHGCILLTYQTPTTPLVSQSERVPALCVEKSCALCFPRYACALCGTWPGQAIPHQVTPGHTRPGHPTLGHTRSLPPESWPLLSRSSAHKLSLVDHAFWMSTLER